MIICFFMSLTISLVLLTYISFHIYLYMLFRKCSITFISLQIRYVSGEMNLLTASKRKRNYILDQTNVYASARKRKMKNFAGFQRVCAVMQPDDQELQQRSWKRTHEDGQYMLDAITMLTTPTVEPLALFNPSDQI